MTKKKKVTKVPTDSIGRPIIPGMRKQPVRFDLTGQDFKRGKDRFIIQGPCTTPGKEHLWVARSSNARDSSGDLYLTKEEIELEVGEKLASSHVQENVFTRRVHV